MKTGIVAVPEFRPAVGMMEVDHNVGRIEQHDQVLRQISESIDTQVAVAEQNRTGFGDSESSADNGEIDIG